jgi:phosphate transport system substrate-binding protein
MWTVTVDTYPRVDGSTSAHPLAVLVACKLLNISYVWVDYYWVAGEAKDLVPNATTPEKEYIEENITAKVVHHGTHDAYVNLINGTTDLILVARSPSADELSLAQTKAVTLDVQAVALDAFIFLLNTNNTINSLTIEQIQQIYTGTITNWSTVGDMNGTINPYQREDNSGSQELMKSLVMKDLEMIDAPWMVLFGMMGPFNRLSTDRYGIGYSVYYFEEMMAPDELKENMKVCAINGTMPTYETIRTKTYLLTADVYVVIRTDLEQTSNAYKLRDWLLSAEGQAVVQESGYVPLP